MTTREKLAAVICRHFYPQESATVGITLDALCAIVEAERDAAIDAAVATAQEHAALVSEGWREETGYVSTINAKVNTANAILKRLRSLKQAGGR